MKTNHILIFSAVGLISAFIVILTGSSVPADTQTANETTAPHVSYPPAMPDSISFCGEPVPMGRPDIDEALDRELLSNTFFHSNTILCLKRSARYFPMIEPILKEYGVPDDFKYLCVAESNLVPTVKSPAGAVGLWQIMEATGKELGMEINREVDDRYNAVKSTHAACKFIKRAYASLGSWTMVAAAYNGGLGRVRRNTSDQKNNNYYDVLWTEETARYVFRILALKTIFNNPQAFGFNVDSMHTYQPYATTTIMADSTIADIAQFAIDHGTTYKAIKTLNPWLRQNRLTVGAGKSYAIELPAAQ